MTLLNDCINGATLAITQCLLAIIGIIIIGAFIAFVVHGGKDE